MTKKILFLILRIAVAFSLTNISYANVFPTRAPSDSCIRFINYDAYNVTKIIGSIRSSVQIEFSPNEEIAHVAIGNSVAWEVAPAGNILFLKAMEAANGNYEKRGLFVLDEIDLLGYMNILEEARDRGRKYGISLMLFYQSVGQIERHFGSSGAMAWFESCAFVSYAAIKDIKTAENISKACGKMTVEVKGSSKSLGTSGAKGTESLNVQQRPLIYPHEITQEMRKDEQIILLQGQPPIRCGRSIYFRRKDLRALAKENRFAPK
ncbi:type IV secretory system conjugative DNA transfer family protein [Bartonella vinsonii]|uniref:type IV secretory system conjugative DNA transfer family protein n=1 Tax=Bartonella vinsonii TaxID=33047 RepID=UPI00034BBA15|nr:type IV secretory system conjugative DNA transfer family protein [Bartonella vinsonii]